MKTLIVGDNTDELAEWANKNYAPISLLTIENLNFAITSELNFYTSLGDLRQDVYLIEALASAEKIIYHAPIEWSDINMQEITEKVFLYFSLQNKIKIENFAIDFDHGNLLSLNDIRQTIDPQFWIVGCSLAHGFSLPDINLRYGQVVADHYKKPVSFLTQVTSSFLWAADQILRSDIREDDLVIWHLPEIHRYLTYRNKSPITLTLASVARKSYLINLITNFTSKEVKLNSKHDTHEGNMLDMVNFLKSTDNKTLKTLENNILDETRLLEAVKSVYQVDNFCRHVGAKLLIISTIYSYQESNPSSDFLLKYLLNFSNYYVLSEKVDVCDDEFHPGPESQKIWVDEIIKIIDDNSYLG